MPVRRRILTKRAKELEGLPELFDKLNDLADIVDSRKIVDILMHGAKVIRDEIKDMAPVGDKPHPPGWLKIVEATFAAEGKPERDRRGPSVLAGVNARKAPQAIWYEFGTSRQSAKPFFRPAKNAALPAVANIVREGLQALIEETAK